MISWHGVEKKKIITNKMKKNIHQYRSKKDKLKIFMKIFIITISMIRMFMIFLRRRNKLVMESKTLSKNTQWNNRHKNNVLKNHRLNSNLLKNKINKDYLKNILLKNYYGCYNCIKICNSMNRAVCWVFTKNYWNLISLLLYLLRSWKFLTFNFILSFL